MKTNELLILGAAGVAVFFVVRLASLRKNAPVVYAGGNTYGAKEIMRDNGWTYYTDGTSIGPDGSYYKAGDLVYDPKGMYQ